MRGATLFHFRGYASKVAAAASGAVGRRSDKVSDIFQTMEYGPAPEDDAGMKAWLEAHNHHFGLFIDGEWHHPKDRNIAESWSPATGDQLAYVTEVPTYPHPVKS